VRSLTPFLAVVALARVSQPLTDGSDLLKVNEVGEVKFGAVTGKEPPPISWPATPAATVSRLRCDER